MAVIKGSTQCAHPDITSFFCIDLQFCYTAEMLSQLVPAVEVALLRTQYV